MRTTFPRRPAVVNGCELSHSVALPREGNSPSMGNRTAAGVICCPTLLSSAEVSIGAAIALASIAASKSWFAFIQLRLHNKRKGESIGRWYRSIPWHQSARRAAVDDGGRQVGASQLITY